MPAGAAQPAGVQAELIAVDAADLRMRVVERLVVVVVPHEDVVDHAVARVAIENLPHVVGTLPVEDDEAAAVRRRSRRRGHRGIGGWRLASPAQPGMHAFEPAQRPVDDGRREAAGGSPAQVTGACGRRSPRTEWRRRSGARASRSGAACGASAGSGRRATSAAHGG